MVCEIIHEQTLISGESKISSEQVLAQARRMKTQWQCRLPYETV